MEIQRIKEIKNTDAFEKFSWAGEDLKQHNLIYGWNGSGKTTISRLFSFLERKNVHLDDLSSIEFTLETDLGLVKQSNIHSHSLNVRVFNEDFIQDNLLFKESHANKIVILGEENVALQQEIEDLKRAHEETVKLLEAKNLVRGKIPKLDDILSEAGREVPKQFANTPLASGGYYGRSYDKRKIDKHIENGVISEDNLESLIITDQAEIDSKREIIKNERNQIEFNIADIEDFSELFHSANELLKISIKVIDIPELSEDRTVRSWVEEGFRLHKEKGLNICKFCNSPIDAELFTKLGEFFTDELSKVKTAIEKIVINLTSNNNHVGYTSSVNTPLLLADLIKEYEKTSQILNKELEIVKGIILSLVEELNKKKDSLHDTSVEYVKGDYPESSVEKANSAIKKLRGIVSGHNTKIEKKSDETTRLALEIELHIIGTILKSKDYFRHKKEIEKTKLELEVLLNESTCIADQINKKKAMLHNASNAVDKINTILKDYFGEAHIYLEVLETHEGEIQYVLKRRGKSAKYLSEGEESVLALVYFLIKLEEDGCNKEDCLVVVDDPVDSQDGIFLFRTAGLIKRQLKDVGQLILLTHNFDFFNLIRDWYLSRSMKEKSKLFLISHNKTLNPREVKIENLPDLLRDYKSEYQYFFCRLYQEAKGLKSLDIPLIPNVARKVLEYFSGFKWACKTTEDFTSIITNRFITSQEELKRGVADFIVKFLHEYSHGQDFSRNISATMMEGGEVANHVMQFIRIADKEHFEDMEELCKQHI